MVLFLIFEFLFLWFDVFKKNNNLFFQMLLVLLVSYIFFLRKNFLYFYFLCFMFFMNLYLVRIGNSYFLLDETDLDDIYPLFTDNSETQRQNSSTQKLASFFKSFFLFQFFNNCRVKFFVCYYFLEVAVHFQYKQSTILLYKNLQQYYFGLQCNKAFYQEGSSFWSLLASENFITRRARIK